MANIHCPKCTLSRREMFRAGLFGLGVRTALPTIFGHTSLAVAAQAFQGGEAHPERILVVVELTGGNDGLDTVAPYGNDDYLRARPTLGVKKDEVLKLNDEFGLHPRLTGLQAIWEQGLVAIVHGCGYPDPDRSHFSSMEFWHTATPHVAQTTGWVGRFADAHWPQPRPNTIVNIAVKESLAVQAKRHSPVVFYRPEEFVRAGDKTQAAAYRELIDQTGTGNHTLDFLTEVSRSAADSSMRVREAVASYQTPVSYGSTPLSMDLRKVAALIRADFPTRVYYVSLGGFDTHASQAGGRSYLLRGLGEGLHAFQDDLKRIGRANDVAMMMFSEFGRRVEENASGGTDHGTAGPMMVIGKSVKGGFYGKHPSLKDLDGNGDLKMTTDFRRVYATMIDEWMGFKDTKSILKGEYETLGMLEKKA
jgi:uncharacterized protein (DUF1501 family)